VKEINFDTISDEIVYDIFGIEGNESEAFNDIYLELFDFLGREGMMKIYKHFRGDKIDFPMRLYRLEFIADLAKPVKDRQERAKIARAGGYSSKAIETLLSKRRKENEDE
jgi:Xaa-Pro aminopeptidase